MPMYLCIHVKSRPRYVSWLICILKPRPPPVRRRVMTVHYPVSLHTKPRPPWRACPCIHPGSSAEKEEYQRLSEKFFCGKRLVFARAKPPPGDRNLRIINRHNKLIYFCHGRAKISRTRDHSQSQSGETVLDLWKT